jgi:hypothetical protein
VHERGLQRLDHLLAVGVARPEPVTARRCRVLRSLSSPAPPPLAQSRQSVARLFPGGHPVDLVTRGRFRDVPHKIGWSADRITPLV